MDQKRGRTAARRFLAAERSNQTHFRAITLVTNVARRRQSRGREDHYLPRTRTVVPSLKQQFVSERCYSDREGGHYDCHYLALRPLSMQESNGLDCFRRSSGHSLSRERCSFCSLPP